MPDSEVNIILPSSSTNSHKPCHQRLRSGSRTRLLFAPKPKLELSWKYANNDSFSARAYKISKKDYNNGDSTMPVSPRSHKFDNPEVVEDILGENALKPIVIKDSSNAMNGLILTHVKSGATSQSEITNKNIGQNLDNHQSVIPDSNSLITSNPINSISKKNAKNKRHTLASVSAEDKFYTNVDQELKKRLSFYGNFPSSSVEPSCNKKKFFRHNSYSGPDSHNDYSTSPNKTFSPLPSGKPKNHSIPNLGPLPKEPQSIRNSTGSSSYTSFLELVSAYSDKDKQNFKDNLKSMKGESNTFSAFMHSFNFFKSKSSLIVPATCPSLKPLSRLPNIVSSATTPTEENHNTFISSCQYNCQRHSEEGVQNDSDSICDDETEEQTSIPATLVQETNGFYKAQIYSRNELSNNGRYQDPNGQEYYDHDIIMSDRLDS